MTMRVVQVVRGLGPGGGASAVAWELHRRFLATGVDARVITGMLTGTSTLPEGVELVGKRAVGLERVSQPWRRLVLPASVAAFGLAAGARLRRLRRTGDRFLVISHGDYPGGDVLVLHSIHAAALKEAWDSGDRRFLLNPIHPAILLRNRIVYRSGIHRRIVVVGARLVADLDRWHRIRGDRVVHIPNGIDVHRFHPERRAARSETLLGLGVDPGTFVVLFAGHEFERKGLEFAIRALAALDATSHLLVVGSDDPARFRRLAAELAVGKRVHFLGRRDDMPELYGAADVFLLPSRYESFGLVCIEAMATGLPVVATRTGGVEDYLTDSRNGLLVHRDPASIASALQRLSGDPALRARLGAEARATAMDFDWDVIAERYLELLEAL